MNTGQDDKKLRALFAELKYQELKRAPAFGSVLNAALRREEFPVFRPALIAAAAAVLVIAAGLAVYQLKAHRSAGESQQWAALSNWQASTDVLLSAAGASPWENQVGASLDDWLDESWPRSITIPETKGGSYEQES